jgi:hypothetical protein
MGEPTDDEEARHRFEEDLEIRGEAVPEGEELPPAPRTRSSTRTARASVRFAAAGSPRPESVRVTVSRIGGAAVR